MVIIASAGVKGPKGGPRKILTVSPTRASTENEGERTPPRKPPPSPKSPGEWLREGGERIGRHDLPSLQQQVAAWKAGEQGGEVNDPTIVGSRSSLPRHASMPELQGSDARPAPRAPVSRDAENKGDELYDDDVREKPRRRAANRKRRARVDTTSGFHAGEPAQRRSSVESPKPFEEARYEEHGKGSAKARPARQPNRRQARAETASVEATDEALPPAAPKQAELKVLWTRDLKLCLYVMDKAFAEALPTGRNREDVWNTVFKGEKIFTDKMTVLSEENWVSRDKLGSQFSEHKKADNESKKPSLQEWRNIKKGGENDNSFVQMKHRVEIAIKALKDAKNQTS